MKTNIWDLFHDGAIVGIEGGAPGDLLLKIEIKCLKQLFSKGNDWFWLELKDCELFEFMPEGQKNFLRDIPSIQKHDL